MSSVDAAAPKDSSLTGADLIVEALVSAGITQCFMNPGTTEMHLLAAIDRNPRMRTILALFEGVATGAADGYARFSDLPAATMLHLGPGLGNGLSNIHNAGKARSGMVNIVGEHALTHLKYDAPLASDIAGIARPVSDWVHQIGSHEEIGVMISHAAGLARKGDIATVVLPADISWSKVSSALDREPSRKNRAVDPAASGNLNLSVIERCIPLLRQPGTMLLAGGEALIGDGPYLLGAIAAATGCRVVARSHAGRMTRGGDRPELERVPFEVDSAIRFLSGVSNLICAGAPAPVSFYGYPGRPGILVPDTCKVTDIADSCSPLEALRAVAELLQVKPLKVPRATDFPMPSGPLTNQVIGQVVAATMPEDTIVVDESVTAGHFIQGATSRAATHDWLNNMGGSIGWGIPIAIGAAVAQPQRRVLALVGDGSALYTVQSLWTVAREQLDITVLILSNREYAVLRGEWKRVGAQLQPDGSLPNKARNMLSLDRPECDWVSIARGHGVDAVSVSTAEALKEELLRSYATKGPRLIEARL